MGWNPHWDIHTFLHGRFVVSVSLEAEVENVSLGDKRLNRRLQKIVKELGDTPTLSIPAATTSRAEMEGAYRFFDNDKVAPDKVLKHHYELTEERISQKDFVLLVQDTTELVLTRPSEKVAGAGPMDSEARRGAFFHPLAAFSIDGLPLGMVWHKIWAREQLGSHLSKRERSKKRSGSPIEEKESFRWIEGIRAARKTAKNCPRTTCVCVGDSEADIYETFAESRDFTTSDGEQGEVHLLVRARQARTTESGDWLEQARKAECIYEGSFNVSPRSEPRIAKNMPRKRQLPRAARIANVEVRATSVKLCPPYRHDRKLQQVSVNLVLIEETKPPKDCEPISWLLATSLPIGTPDEVKRIATSYCVRWQIEIFFRTLKSGCRIEQRQFEKLNRIVNCLAVYSIVAWRVTHLCHLGRQCPDLNCEVVFEPCEWKAVYKIVKKKAPPSTPPRLNEIIRMVAGLGGYVNRKSTEPGPQTLWIGLQRVHDLSTAWNEFRTVP